MTGCREGRPDLARGLDAVQRGILTSISTTSGRLGVRARRPRGRRRPRRRPRSLGALKQDAEARANQAWPSATTTRTAAEVALRPERRRRRSGSNTTSFPSGCSRSALIRYRDDQARAPRCLHGQRPSSARASRGLGIPASRKSGIIPAHAHRGGRRRRPAPRGPGEPAGAVAGSRSSARPATASSLLALVREHAPDLAIVDIRMPPDAHDRGARRRARDPRGAPRRRRSSCCRRTSRSSTRWSCSPAASGSATC